METNRDEYTAATTEVERLREALESIKDYAFGGWLQDESVAFPEEALSDIGTRAEEALRG